ncbi:MAG: hypothetical protein D6B25_09725 [Desulfobulbaceae bacterium]|nr:MAG: hypothetical protein D6B25_09725 [Desulfobulbaceae bacterium]
MKWLEVIHLRSTEQDPTLVDNILQQLIEEVHRKKGKGVVQLYKRASVASDVALQIRHDSEQVSLPGSKLGLNLANALKPYGMLNHTIWVLDKETADSH